ncbi:MAG: hypothetical protein JO108_34100 [Acidobacteriaceae bacterium]|nr:hypothetical protein [Acidobacteriaceae bacterium]
MALERIFRELPDSIRKLRDSMLALQLTIREDFPLHGSVVLVDQFGDAVDDSLGWLEDSLTAAIEVQECAKRPVDIDRARRALAICQEQFHRMVRRFDSDLVSYEKLKDLTGFGRSRRGEWLGWVKSVRKGLDECRQPMEEVSKALLACWQEIAEHAHVSSVSVQATNIGQQIAAPELISRTLASEGIT